MLGVSNSVLYQLTDYIGYDIMLQYIQELLQQARAMISTGNYPQAVWTVCSITLIRRSNRLPFSRASAGPAGCTAGR